MDPLHVILVNMIYNLYRLLKLDFKINTEKRGHAPVENDKQIITE